MKSYKRGVIWFLGLAVSLLLCGCPYDSEIPLGAAGDAEVDKELIGKWRSEDTQEKTSWTVTVYPLNDREFLVVSLGQGENEIQIEFHRAFVTRIGGEKFLNVQEVKLSDAERTWVFANYAITKDELSVRFVEDKLFKEKFDSSEALRNFIRANLQNKDLYEKDGKEVFKRIME